MFRQKSFRVVHQGNVLKNFFNVPVPPLDGEKFFHGLLVEAVLDDAGGVADGYRVRRNVFGDDGFCADDCAVADFHAAHNRCAVTDPNVVPDDYLKMIRASVGQRINNATVFQNKSVHVKRKS